MQVTNQQMFAALQIAKAVIDSIKETGERGLPGGTIYAALMSHGVTLNGYENLMDNITRTGLVAKRGELYHYVGPKPA